MNLSGLPEPLRRRAEELDSRPPLLEVRDFLGGYLADAVSLDEVQRDLRTTAAVSVRALRRFLHAFDAFMAEPHPEGLLAHIVAWDANWVLDDPSDAGAEAFLRQVAQMVRAVIEEATGQRPST